MDFSEKMISTLSVVVRRRVNLGMRSGGRGLYANFSEFALSAYQWFVSSLLDEPMFTAMKRLDFDSPVKALSFEFIDMLEIEQVFDMICLVIDIRHRTFDIEVIGRIVTDRPRDLFVARITPIMLSRTERRSIEIPDVLRQRLERYREQTK